MSHEQYKNLSKDLQQKLVEYIKIFQNEKKHLTYYCLNYKKLFSFEKKNFPDKHIGVRLVN